MSRGQLPIEPPCEWCGRVRLWANERLICANSSCGGLPLVPAVVDTTATTAEEES